MRLSSFLFFICITVTGFGQHQLKGVVTEKDTGNVIPYAEVYLTNLNKSTTTDLNGDYVFENLPEGSHTLVVYNFEFEISEQIISLTKKTVLNIELGLLGETLSEVVISNRKERIFALKQLKGVEGTAIYEGKKSEVVLVENLTANLATGNARQIYAQVVGLNIYENNDAGLQLNIGGRGLDPNRTSNFNTRQNGYDISADVLGYPESYYTPPAEAIDQIEVVRGAASLQYGTQFGGLINFKLKQPNPNKEIELISRQTVGSYNLFTSFNSLSGTLGKVGYYSYFNYKSGEDFRPNSEFDSYNAFGKVTYQVSDKTKITGEFSYLNYLAQQSGGLTDSQFEEDPTQSNRTRNFFKVNWNLFSVLLEHELSEKTEMSINLFALDASRETVGIRENRVSQNDDLEAPREVITGKFRNWGAEGRLITRYDFLDVAHTLLVGAKYYQSNNTERQGPGTNGTDADFNFADDDFPDFSRQSDFTFPNLNLAVFTENIFQVTEQFTVTPGFRFEYIKTESEGIFKNINLDNAGNVILNETLDDNRTVDRAFVLAGLGLSYKAKRFMEFYGNVSENYRSVTFNDIRIVNPSLTVDPNITDEQGFTVDLGVRGRFKKVLSYDVSAFFLNYEDRLGVILRDVSDIETEQFRGNIGDAVTYGIESFIDWNIWNTFSEDNDYKLSVFSNLAITESEYTSSEENNVEGNEVEFIPKVNFKTGLKFGYKDLLGSLQYTYLSRQFTDATNSLRDFSSQSGIIGEIPSYNILDLSLSYTYKRFKLESGINNLLDNSYFVRRATGYPGPGIIPSQPRTFYAGLQFKI